VRGGGGSGWLGRLAESIGREREKRKRAEQHACFGRKMVYGKFFCKPFS
jgi:hypothetical protein